MSIALGLNSLTNVRFDDTQVSSVYLGTNLVWSSYAYPLDLYGSAYHAYSLRKLRSAYAGFCLRVRRPATTPTEVNVGFDSNNKISLNSPISYASGATSAAINLGQFAAASASGYSNPDGITINQSVSVVTWYDQSGNGKNVTQALTAQQPRLINAGVLETIDGSVGVRFSSVSSQLLNIADTATPYNNASVYVLSNSVSALTNTSAYGLGFLSTNARMFIPSGTSISYDTSGTFPISGISANVDRLYELICGASTTSAYSNGTISSVPSIASVSSTNVYIRIGSNGSPSVYMNGHVKEVIAFVGAPNRTSIESNINSYYSVW